MYFLLYKFNKNVKNEKNKKVSALKRGEQNLKRKLQLQYCRFQLTRYSICPVRIRIYDFTILHASAR